MDDFCQPLESRGELGEDEVVLGELRGGEEEVGLDDSGPDDFSVAESFLPFAATLGTRDCRIREVTSQGPNLG